MSIRKMWKVTQRAIPPHMQGEYCTYIDTHAWQCHIVCEIAGVGLRGEVKLTRYRYISSLTIESNVTMWI
jgi:hypothetical protein